MPASAREGSGKVRRCLNRLMGRPAVSRRAAIRPREVLRAVRSAGMLHGGGGPASGGGCRAGISDATSNKRDGRKTDCQIGPADFPLGEPSNPWARRCHRREPGGSDPVEDGGVTGHQQGTEGPATGSAFSNRSEFQVRSRLLGLTEGVTVDIVPIPPIMGGDRQCAGRKTAGRKNNEHERHFRPGSGVAAPGGT